MRKFTLIIAALMSLTVVSAIPAIPAVADEDGFYVPTLHVLAHSLILHDMSMENMHPTLFKYVRVPIAGTSQGVSKIECEMRMDALNEYINLMFGRPEYRSWYAPVDKDNGILVTKSDGPRFSVELVKQNQPRITCESKI